MSKKVYKIKNWKEYNNALVNRGNITIWFSDDALKNWYSGRNDLGRGRPYVYSDACIELALTIKHLYQLPLRATVGFLTGMFSLLEIKLDVPHYSRLSRRAVNLKIGLSCTRKSSEKIDLVVDSTGLKIYGEGEWKVRIHGKQKRRTWRKFHVAVDPRSHQAIAVELTKADVADTKMMPKLIKDLKNIDGVYADGAYPYKDGLDAISAIGAIASIPARSGTTLSKNPSPGLEQRNRIILETWKAGGREQWKKTSGHHLRSLVETHMSRFKTILGDKMSARSFENQIVEARLKTSILNRMTQLGMPVTVTIN
jgi:hypothetical protein